MRGSPGTGKTHLIRAMLLEVPDAMFVLISPEMVTNLAGPELLPVLLQNRGCATGPIVLILEDADKCLVARDKDNMNSIQSLLNLGDGILGSLLDLRIIATTNAHELHMEEALMRPGRLSKMLEVGPLDPKTAQGIFKRLLPDQPIPTELCPMAKDTSNWKMTLAEAYALARRHGWAPDERKVEVDTENEYYDE
jgi:AAA family ATPase